MNIYMIRVSKKYLNLPKVRTFTTALTEMLILMGSSKSYFYVF